MKIQIVNSIHQELFDIDKSDIKKIYKSNKILIKDLISLAITYITSYRLKDFYYLLEHYSHDQIIDSVYKIIKVKNSKSYDVPLNLDLYYFIVVPKDDDIDDYNFVISFLPPMLMAIKYKKYLLINEYINTMKNNRKIINQHSPRGDNMLHYAISYKLDNKLIYKMLHQEGANELISSTTSFNDKMETPLDYAIDFQKDNIILFAILLNLRSFTMKPDKLLQLIFTLLSVDNSYRFKDEMNNLIKKLILENTNRFFTYQKILNFSNNSGYTPLIMAIYIKNEPITNFILDLASPDVINKKDNNGRTAISFVDDINLFKKLISKGADINALDNNNNNLLHINAGIRKRPEGDKDNVSIIEYILNSDTFLKDKINEKNILGNTPLHEAFKNNKMAIILTLIKYGAKLTIKNDEGETPLTINPKITRELNKILVNAN